MKTMTQCDMVLRYMQEHGSISPLEAVRDIHCYSLAARIKNLRDDGVNIKAVPVTTKNVYGKSCTYSRYSLAEVPS